MKGEGTWARLIDQRFEARQYAHGFSDARRALRIDLFAPRRAARPQLDLFGAAQAPGLSAAS